MNSSLIDNPHEFLKVHCWLSRAYAKFFEVADLLASHSLINTGLDNHQKSNSVLLSTPDTQNKPNSSCFIPPKWWLHQGKLWSKKNPMGLGF